MIRYIPQLILEHFAKQEIEGRLLGFALLFDIADFTPISAEMQKHGKQGAEELSFFLDYVFGEPIRIVESWGGFVSLFAGDAFCAIFPDDVITKPTNKRTGDEIALQKNECHQRILAAVQEIAKYFEDKDTYNCSIGSFPLKVRQTVSYGEITWQIYENALQNEYVFSGKPLQELAELSNLKQESIFSYDSARKIGIDYFVPHKDNAMVIADGIEDKFSTLPKYPVPSQQAFSHSTISRFIHPKYQNITLQPELRSAAFCFANLGGIIAEQRAHAVSTLQDLADKYGGFINKYDATDKGLSALILFGIPKSEDRTLERICNFSLEAVESLPQLSMGISCGSVIACYTGSGIAKEYTAIGAPVNLASRLMSRARPGEVLCDTYLWQELHSQFDFSYLGSLSVKGIKSSIGFYRLRKLSQTRNREESPFVGREQESAKLSSIIESSLHSNENVIVYVCGDAGIGKSRLVTEVLSPYGSNATVPSQNCFKYYLTCDMILKKPLEAIKQLVRAHFYYNSLMPPEAGIAMFRALWNTICPTDPEMQRIESIIASLLDYSWEGSIWSMLPPKEKPNQLKQAFVYFVQKLCAQKPIIINLDDGQWLDEESKSYLQAVSNAGIKPFIIVSPCRYLENGAKPELNLKNHIRHDLELSSLSERGSSELIKRTMRLSHIPQATNNLIQSRSMGNPLFIEQLSSYLLETDSVNDKGEIIKELGYLSTFSISDIISSRIDRLTQNVKECLYGASVLGMEFDVRILSDMLKTDLSSELEDGKENQIWKELKEIHYIFSHILIKDIAYQSMLSRKLKELHKFAAESMEKIFQDKLNENAEEIALHFERAELKEKAAFYFDKAGSWYRKAFEFEKSRQNLIKALDIREKVLGDEHPDMASSLNNLASLYDNQGKYAEAEPLYLQSLAIHEKVLGVEHPDTAFSLHNLASLYHSQGKYAEAEPMHLRALAIREKVLGSEHQDTASSLDYLANLYRSEGKHGEAESLHLRALAIREKVLGAEHPYTAFSLNNLALLYSDQGKYAEAEPLLLRAQTIMGKVLGVEHPQTANSLGNLANLYRNQGKYDEAEPLYLRALAIREKVLGAEHPSTASSLDNLASLYFIQGRYVKAEPLYMRAIEVGEKVLGAEHPQTAFSLNNLANLYCSQGKYAKAEPLYLRAQATMKKVLGVEHPQTANSLHNLALVYKNQGKYDEAESFNLRVLSIREKVLGTEHPDTAKSLNNLASLYNVQGKYAEAEPLLLRALAIWEKVLGAEHPDTALSIDNLGQLHKETGDFQKAEEMYLKAFEIWRKSYGFNHHWTISVLKSIIDLYEKMSLPEKAVHYKAMLPAEKDQQE